MIVLWFFHRKLQLHSSPMNTPLMMLNQASLPQQRKPPPTKPRALPLKRSSLHYQRCRPWLHPRQMQRRQFPRIRCISCMGLAACPRAPPLASLLFANWTVNNQCLYTRQVTQLFPTLVPDFLKSGSSAASWLIFPAFTADVWLTLRSRRRRSDSRRGQQHSISWRTALEIHKREKRLQKTSAFTLMRHLILTKTVTLMWEAGSCHIRHASDGQKSNQWLLNRCGIQDSHLSCAYITCPMQTTGRLDKQLWRMWMKIKPHTMWRWKVKTLRKTAGSFHTKSILSSDSVQVTLKCT